MTPEEFRVAGHALIDWIVDHRLASEDRPVRAQVAPGDIRSRFGPPPTTTSSVDDLLSALERDVAPGVMDVQHPMHFGWFPSNASLSSVLGDLASSGLGGLGISWESCPSLTEVEEVVCDWMRQLTGLSDAWSGTITDTASTGTLTAVLVARERSTELSQNQGGFQAEPKPLVVYTTAQAHSSVAKAALLAGFGWENIRTVDVTEATQAMDPRSLQEAIAADRAAGKRPCVVIANVGSTGVTAIDPIAEIAEITTSERVWLHVDAAMAGSGMLLPELRHLWHGVEKADSISWNPHKWMGTILDCSLLYLRDTAHLTAVMSTNPTYLQSAADGEVTQYRDWGIPLGRRFRALKLWFQLELDGVEAIQTRLRRDLANAQWLADQVEAAADWELVSPLTLQTVCVRHHPPTADGSVRSPAELDAHNQAWVHRINESGRAFMSTATLNDQWMVRVSIGVTATERRHVEALWKMMQDEAAVA